MAPNERWAAASQCFDELVELDRDARAARLDALAAEDPALAQEVARLLAADERTDGLLDAGIARAAPTVAGAVARGGEVRDETGTTLGAFRLQGLLGRGGMGEVYLAERTVGDARQPVAIKLLKRGLDSRELLARFAQERRILAQLNHPHVARFLDAGVAPDGRPYFAMELVEGRDIVRHANEQGMDTRARVALFAQVCDAVAYAHSRLVVHRDLKPSNVLIDANGQPRVLDFGIAKLLDDPDATLTGTGARAMSPAYAAPEQILGEPSGTATDVYSLGVVLFELLTGSLPHRRHGPPEALVRTLDTESTARPSDAARTQPGRRARDLAGDLDTIVLVALRREPERRYATAAALADDLRRWLDGRPIAARADSAAYRFGKLVRRHRAAAAATLLVALALVAGLALALWQAGIAREQAVRAQAQARRAEALQSFTLSLFREQDPFARGRPQARTPTELVALGVERAQAQFQDAPALRASVLVDLGDVLLNLGEFARARDALAPLVTDAALAANDPALHALAQSRHAAAVRSLGDNPAALVQSEAALVVLRRTAGPDAPATLEAEDRRARMLLDAGRADEAIATARGLIVRHERVDGRDAPATLAALADLTAMLEQVDRLDEADTTARDVLARMEATLGTAHPALLRVLSRIGDIARRRQQYDVAEEMYARAVAIARAHETTVPLGQILTRRGDLLRRQQRLDEAQAHFDEAATLLPAGSPELAQVEMYRGGLARARDDERGAAAAFLRSYESFRAALGPGSVFPWNSALEHVRSRCALGEADAAQALLDEASAALAKLAPAPSYDAMLAADVAAGCRARQGRHAEAMSLWIAARDSALAVYGPAHASTLDARLSLAEAAARTGDRETAQREAAAVLAEPKAGEAAKARARAVADSR